MDWRQAKKAISNSMTLLEGAAIYMLSEELNVLCWFKLIACAAICTQESTWTAVSGSYMQVG